LPLEPGVAVTPADGRVRGMDVRVGRGVFVNVAVGGMGVAVGMAAWVSAITVKAAAATVPWKSIGAAVGAGCPLHPLMSRAITRNRVGMKKRFMQNLLDASICLAYQ
jgi:hypothetical protein